MKKLAIIKKEKCNPGACSRECEKFCPINKKGEKCVVIENKARIDEGLCIGCSICERRCPLNAINIINLPSLDEKKLIHRYGKNGFALYGLPLPRENSVVGLLGKNGIGKSSAVKILSKQEKMNLGKEEVSNEDIINFFKGSEFLNYFKELENKKIGYKPQNLSFLAVNLKVKELLLKIADENKVKEISKKLNAEQLLEKDLNTLSGGELQKIAIIATCLKEADIYFFDEPLAYLDIEERLRVAEFIKEISFNKRVVVVEHDLLIMDYLTEYINIFYGKESCYGVVSGIKSTSYGINSYLEGFLKEENVRIREKSLNFNLNKIEQAAGHEIASWPSFKKSFNENFSLEVKEGKIKTNHLYGIIGKNGTGKTTFVKCLAGLEEVDINGEKKKLDLKLDISYKPQYLFSDSEELVREVVFREKINKRLVTDFSLENIYTKKIKELSGGELQRLSIARCLSKNADIYLIDEPSAYLDVEERIEVAKIIKDFMLENEKICFVVDHDLLLISYLADSILVFSGERGKFGKLEGVFSFKEGISLLLKELGITLRKDKESGRPKINKKDSYLDREQKEKNEWVVF